jgi:hypothetical protein
MRDGGKPEWTVGRERPPVVVVGKLQGQGTELTKLVDYFDHPLHSCIDK